MARRAHGTGSIWTERRGGYHVWIGQIRVRGRQHQKTLGRVPKNKQVNGITKQQAEAELRQFRAEVEERAVIESTRVKDDAVRLSVVAEAHFLDLETLDARKPWTVADYRQILKTHLLPYFGDVPLDEISTQSVEAFVQHQMTEGGVRRPGKGLGASTVANHVNVLGAIYRSAMRRGLIAANPVAAAKKPRVSKTDKDLRFLTIEEVDALIRAAPTTPLGKTDAVVYLTAAMTGLRRGELVALRWRDVDWVASKIRVRGSRRRGLTSGPKSEMSKRAVPMAARVAGALDRHFQQSRHTGNDDLVFPNPETGRHLDPDAMTSRFKAALDGAALPKIRFHDLRHTFGTLMAASGTDVRLLKQWMGHAALQTTEIYMHYAPRADEAAMVDRAFDGLSVEPAQPRKALDEERSGTAVGAR